MPLRARLTVRPPPLRLKRFGDSIGSAFTLDTTYLLEAPDNWADFFLVVRDRLNHASCVAWQTIDHTYSPFELLSRPWIKIVDLAVPTEHPICAFTHLTGLDRATLHIGYLRALALHRPGSLSVILG
jgi:hypothetical protein